jgi:hypothetical protein
MGCLFAIFQKLRRRAKNAIIPKGDFRRFDLGRSSIYCPVSIPRLVAEPSMLGGGQHCRTVRRD